MFTMLIILAIYSLLILLFVPLEKIADIQTKTRKKWKELLDKINTK